MAKFKEAVKDKVYKCDKCNQKFKGEAIVLKPAPEKVNIQILTPIANFLFVDSEGGIVCSPQQPVTSEGDFVAHCPLCDCAHFFGFEAA